MATLFDIMLATCGYMGKLHSGFISTKNAVDVITDQYLVANDSDYVGGTLFFVKHGVSARVTALNATSKQIGFSPSNVLTVTNDSYAVTTVGRDDLVNAINTALLSMGEHIGFADLTVTSNADGDYEMPENTSISNVKRIEIRSLDQPAGTVLTDSYRYWRISSWHNVQNGLKNLIVLDGYRTPLSVTKMRVWQNEPHSWVAKDTDLIHPDYHKDRLAFEAAYYAYFQFLADSKNSDDKVMMMFQNMMLNRQKLAAKYPVPHLYRDPIYSKE